MEFNNYSINNSNSRKSNNDSSFASDGFADVDSFINSNSLSESSFNNSFGSSFNYSLDNSDFFNIFSEKVSPISNTDSNIFIDILNSRNNNGIYDDQENLIIKQQPQHQQDVNFIEDECINFQPYEIFKESAQHTELQLNQNIIEESNSNINHQNHFHFPTQQPTSSLPTSPTSPIEPISPLIQYQSISQNTDININFKYNNSYLGLILNNNYNNNTDSVLSYVNNNSNINNSSILYNIKSNNINHYNSNINNYNNNNNKEDEILEPNFEDLDSHYEKNYNNYGRNQSNNINQNQNFSLETILNNNNDINNNNLGVFNFDNNIKINNRNKDYLFQNQSSINQNNSNNRIFLNYNNNENIDNNNENKKVQKSNRKYENPPKCCKCRRYFNSLLQKCVSPACGCKRYGKLCSIRCSCLGSCANGVSTNKFLEIWRIKSIKDNIIEFLQ